MTSRPAVASLEIAARRLRPVKHSKAGVSEGGAQSPLEFARRAYAPELDDESPRRGLTRLGLELPRDEADGHDAVLLGGGQELGPRPLPRRLVLEGDLVEARQRVAHVRLVVDGQPSPSSRIDVGEGAIGQPRTLLGVELAHVGLRRFDDTLDAPMSPA